MRNRNISAAFSLLEVILAIAILAGVLATLGEVVREAGRGAELASQEAIAQLLATSVMSEIQAGIVTATPVSNVPCDQQSNPPWVYAIDIEQTTIDALLLVRVRVEQQRSDTLRPIAFELARWLPDPNLVASDTEGTP